MIRNCCTTLIFSTLLAFSLPAQAHIFGYFGHGSEVDYSCKPHHHGRFLHRCSDEPHPRMDESHRHPNLPAYYARKPDFYLGAKSGSLHVSSKNYDVNGTPTAILTGYGSHTIAGEIEISRAIINSTDPFAFRFATNDKGRYDTLGLYLTHRTSGNVYFKFRAGVRKNWTKLNGERFIDEDFTAGFGAGKQLGRFMLEGEYTYLESNVHLYTLGINYKF